MQLNSHQTDERLEEYALGRLSESEVPVFEEHLMVCGDCRERLDQVDAFALGMRQALKEAPPEVRAGWKWFDFGFMKKPVFALAVCATVLAAVAVSLVSVFSLTGTSRVVPVASLQLMAIRGDMQSVPEARELDLILVDAPATGGPFRIEVVNAAGGPQWTGAGTAVKVQRRLEPGVYFVRLYGLHNQVQHEYGFRVTRRAR